MERTAVLTESLSDFPKRFGINNYSPEQTLSLSSEYFTDFMQAVKGFHGGKIIDIEMEYLIAYGSEHGVVELEKRQLGVGGCHV